MREEMKNVEKTEQTIVEKTGQETQTPELPEQDLDKIAGGLRKSAGGQTSGGF